MEDFLSLANTTNLSETLLDLFRNRSELRQAISIASSDLHVALLQIIRGEKLSPKKHEQIISSLFKYVLRMTTRATPFGLFSFVSLGKWSSFPSPDPDLNQVKKRARPSMDWLMDVVNQFALDPLANRSFSLQRNALLQESMGKILVPQPKKQDRVGREISINATPLVRYILERCKLPHTPIELVQLVLSEFPSLKEEKIDALISTLIDLEVLYPSFFPSLLTRSPLEDLLKQPFFEDQMKEISPLLDRYNPTTFREGEEELRVLQETMRKKVPKISSPLQVDSSSDQEFFLPPETATHLSKGVEILWSLSSARRGYPSLRSYHMKFLSKYGAFKAVPLMEVLDPIVGLGIPETYAPDDPDEFEKETPLEPWLLEKWVACVREGKREIELSDEVVQKFLPLPDFREAPSSFDVCFEMAEEEGHPLILMNSICDAANGCATIGRFIDMLGPEGSNKVREFLEEEESLEPETFFAEVSYFPQNPKNANVVIHPNLRPFSLNLGYGCPGNQSLCLEQISVVAAPTHLFLLYKGKKLQLSATNVLGSKSTPPLVRFLREVSGDFSRRFILSPWGSLTESPFLPSIRYQNMLLAAASWKLSLLSLNASEKESPESLLKKLKHWIKASDLPRFVLLVLADHRILLDTLNSSHLKEITRRLKNNPQSFLVLMEKRGKITSGYQHEFVVPFLKTKEYRPFPEENNSITSFQAPLKKEPPGDKWLYAKIYNPKKQENRLLLTCLPSLLQNFGKEISSWFFIRYTDGDGSHIRFRCKARQAFGGPLDIFHTWAKDLMDRGWVRDLCLGSYERENDRYGGEQCIDLAEEFFCADSEAVLGLLNIFYSKKIDLSLDVLASWSLIDLLHGFGLSFENQELFIQEVNKGADKSLLGGFRIWKDKLLSHLLASSHEASQVFEIFSKRRKKQFNYAQAIKGLSDQKTILRSLLHMHCNRLLGTDRNLEQKALFYAGHAVKTINAKQAAQRNAFV